MPAPTPRSPPMLARNVTHFVRLLRGAGMPLKKKNKKNN